MIGLKPFCEILGGAEAREPSPRNKGPSSVLTSCAASRMVKGRTRTATVMELAPSAGAMVDSRQMEDAKTPKYAMQYQKMGMQKKELAEWRVVWGVR